MVNALELMADESVDAFKIGSNISKILLTNTEHILEK